MEPGSYNVKMSSLWNSSSAESGILRKHDVKDKLDDLLVFGYACKLFRDDHKALDIDQGKHLIPWMGENSLKIDRYDGRGALSDLKPFEASKEGYDAMRWLGLSESDRKIEQLCDEERYYALHTNEDDDELYKEEELKRLQSNQVQYTYNDTAAPGAATSSEDHKTDAASLVVEDDDDVFVPAPGSDIPVNMSLPKTVKQNARIEKTASFISKQGPQMEILLKTKQSGNPQFSFLNQDDPLYRYYRHVLMAIKTGRYQIPEEQSKNHEENTKQEDEHYLHPSLAAVALQPIHSAPIIPQINYKPSANCAYSQLINKIKGNQPITTVEQQQQPKLEQYYQLQFYQQYGYWPQIDQQYYQQQSGTNTNQYLQYSASSIEQQQQQQTSVNPYAQIVSNVKSKDDPTDCTKPKDDARIEQPSLFSLAQYSGSETDNEDDDDDDDDTAATIIPQPDVQVIVDKMASYVAKNGSDFEAIVKAKGDPRFIFLETNHLYNPYYKMKLREFQGLKNDEGRQKEDKKTTKTKEKKIITPVSFSIKKHSMDGQPVPRDKSALPIEDSTDDDDDEDVKEQLTTIDNNNEDAQCNDEQIDAPETTKTDEEQQTNPIIEIEDPIMELIDLTEDLEEKRDRRAEDRVKDKLALAAREKLAAKNRALQLERKKRAAAFLSQLKPQSSSKHDLDEIKLIRAATPPTTEDGEINNDAPPIISEEYSRLIYHIESDKYPTNDCAKNTDKRPRSRSNSRTTHKTTHHQHHHRRKTHKRSHSHSRKRKREKRSHERKKSKRRHRSRSRSTSKHRKVDKKDILTDIENKSRKTEQYSVSSSDYESDDYPAATTTTTTTK